MVVIKPFWASRLQQGLADKKQVCAKLQEKGQIRMNLENKGYLLTDGLFTHA